MLITLVSFLLLTTFVIFGSQVPGKKYNNVGKFAPKVNLSPKYFMTIKGDIDPNLKNKIQIKWTTTYYSTNANCQVPINPLKQVYSSREQSDVIYVNPNTKGHYEYKLAIDQYKPGYCGWKIFGVSYSITLNNHSTIDARNTGLTFSDEAHFSTKEILQKWRCNQDICELTKNNLYTAFSGQLDRNNNYQFIVNFIS